MITFLAFPVLAYILAFFGYSHWIWAALGFAGTALNWRRWGLAVPCLMLLLSTWWIGWAESFAANLNYPGFVDPQQQASILRNTLAALPLPPFGLLVWLLRGREAEELREGFSHAGEEARKKLVRKKVPKKPTRSDNEALICYTLSGAPVVLKDKDRYLHTLVTGPIGSGKSSRIIKPRVEQEMEAISRSLINGIPRGLTLIEPKGDLAKDAREMARYYNVPYIYIDPTDPETSRFNPLEGDPVQVAEATRTVLRATFGKQDPYFAWNQEMAARNTVLLLKYLYRDDVTMVDLVRYLRNQTHLKSSVDALEKLLGSIDRYIREAEERGDYRKAEHYRRIKDNRDTASNVVDYFKTEVIGDKMADDSFRHTSGLRLQIEDLAGNEFLNRVINARSDVDLDVHLNRGGVLIVNTAMGPLGKLGDVFGQFLTMHFQNAVFRREGSEFTRAHHCLIIDEAHRYLNPDFERLLAMGRSYRCESLLALQNTSQLILDERHAFRENMLGLCRNKIVFGGISAEEARIFSREFGEYETTATDRTRPRGMFFKSLYPVSEREKEKTEERFKPTDLMELPENRVVYKIVKNNRPQPPGIGKTSMSRWDKIRPQAEPGLELGGASERKEEKKEFSL